jgi:3-deoxy-D-manno-octulosonic-acid transferase
VIFPYYLLLTLALVTAGPILLLSKKARAGLAQKFGFIPQDFADRVATVPASTGRVWFHSVSVGEFNALFPLLEEFHKRHPEYKLFVSTTTRTGQELAQSKAGSIAEVFYFPFDLPFAHKSWLDLIKPKMVGIVETEIWPGFMTECSKRNITVVLLNGRLSPKSFKGYLNWRWFFGPIISKFSALAVQSESEKERFFALGGNAVPTVVSGNIKLDGLRANTVQELDELRKKTGLYLSVQAPVVVAGSTHEGEESAFLSILKDLNASFRLVLVPRHPERFDRVAQLIESYGFRARRFSKGEKVEQSNDVFLLDTIGQLKKFFGISDIAFVGGTIANIGGHNLAEPCIYSVPVICGPHVHKTKDLSDKLLDCSALIKCDDEKEIKSQLQLLLNSPEQRRVTGANGFRFLSESQGALERTLSVLEQYLLRDLSGREKKAETRVKVGGSRR